VFFFVAILETERVNKALCTFDYFNLCGAGSTKRLNILIIVEAQLFPNPHIG
jgi:hypothetical protein